MTGSAVPRAQGDPSSLEEAEAVLPITQACSCPRPSAVHSLLKAEVSNESYDSDECSSNGDDAFVEHAMAEVDKWIHCTLSHMSSSV